MKEVAKALIKTEDGEYLVLQLNQHPVFQNDPDLPGGTADEGETPETTVTREVLEEIGIDIGADNSLVKLYEGTEYSAHGTKYHLFQTTLSEKPEVTLSWEHQSYAWASRAELLEQCDQARDTYMKMVAEIIKHTDF